MTINKTINFDLETAVVIDKLAAKLGAKPMVVIRAILDGVATQYLHIMSEGEEDIKNVMVLNVQIAVPKY